MRFNEAEFSRSEIVRICDRALREAGAAGTFPTPLEALEPVAGIVAMLDISELADEPEFVPPRAFGRILGALHFGSRTAFIDGSQIEGRTRWTRGHEITHSLVPWHRTSALFDNEEQLFRATEEMREWEANVGAAHLLFQGNRFLERAMSYQRTIKTPILLAAEFGASIHATIWYYVEYNPEPMALAVAGRHVRANGHVPIFRTVESAEFKNRFGAFRSHLPVNGLPAEEGFGGDAIAKTVEKARLSVGQVEVELRLQDLRGNDVVFRGEVFFNQRCFFLVVAPKRVLQLGRRIKLASV